MPKPATPWLSFALLAVLGLAGCGDDAAPPTASSAALAPSDPALAKIYDSSCKLCHANPASGAPQSGDAKAWQPRVAQGADSLLDHSINGFKGMPPMGMCMQCSEEEFLALISFMSGQPVQ
ncbi:c-type cytochrome [Pseudomonas nicosulfuronedens]